MPFISLADQHRCPLPKTRDDGTPLVIGDVWRCDYKMRNGSESLCGLTYRWTDTPMESYWKDITGEKTEIRYGKKQ